MATYNGEKFLREQIDSILNQTIQDFELIVCDDCSTDSTWQILQAYAGNSDRIHLYRNDQNIGFKKNFEKAISFCTGEYIALSDQDDIWLPHHLEFLLNNISGRSLAGGNAELIDGSGRKLNRLLNEVDGFLYFPEGSKFLWRVLLKGDPIQGASMLLCNNFVRKCLPVPEGVRFHDAWFAACACFENGISYSFDVITKYRQHGNNITYLMHNKVDQSSWQRFGEMAKKLLNGNYSDRFSYIDELQNKYHSDNVDFVQIANFINNLSINKVSPRDIIMLWKNYENITTQHNHKYFFKNCIRWLRWKKELPIRPVQAVV